MWLDRYELRSSYPLPGEERKKHVILTFSSSLDGGENGHVEQTGKFRYSRLQTLSHNLKSVFILICGERGGEGEKREIRS